MIFSKIWERKLFIDVLKYSLFFMLCFFLVFVFIDFSLHSAKLFSQSSVTFLDILKYYYNFLIIELNLFLALTFMLAIIKILADMNIHHELTALRMAGLSAKLISRPFLIFAVLISLFSFINYEFFLPKAIDFKENFKERFLKKTKYNKMHPNVIYLEDNTRLVYQKYNKNEKELFDVFWIKDNSNIWHAKILNLQSTPIIGYFVDHFVKNSDTLEKEKSYNSYIFNDILVDQNRKNMFCPCDQRAISTLIKQSSSKNICQKEKSELLSNVNYKLAMPFFPILIIISLFPFLITFSKNISIFFICAFSLFGFVIFYTLMDSALIVAESASKGSYLIIWMPLIISFLIFGKKYMKT
ncbi:MAG: LptF/LptG family permease [Parachlamydiales bacterium]|nr:LptF/LptG family permease [Parachlamydiales bacterium]